MVCGMAATKQDLMAWVEEVGLAVLDEVFKSDVEALTGPKGKHRAERTHLYGVLALEQHLTKL